MMLPKLVRSYREQHNISVRGLAKIIGVDYSTLFRFECGKEITVSTWVKIVKWALVEDAR